MYFEKTIAGMNYVANNNEAVVYTLRADGRFAGTSAATSSGDRSDSVVTASGWRTTSMSGNPMTQLINGEWICVPEGWTPTYNYVQYPQKTAQQYVNEVIKNNKHILENNLVCARFAHKLDSTQRATLYNLQARLQTRNDSLLKDGLVTSQTASAPKGYAELQPYLDNVMSEGIGSVTVAIVIGAVVIASLATAAYFCYKYYAAESTKDVKFSDDLTKALLAKLTPEEYEQLMSETKGLVTQAALKERFGSNLKWWLLAGGAIAILGGLGYFKFNKRNG